MLRMDMLIYQLHFSRDLIHGKNNYNIYRAYKRKIEIKEEELFDRFKTDLKGMFRDGRRYDLIGNIDWDDITKMNQLENILIDHDLDIKYTTKKIRKRIKKK